MRMWTVLFLWIFITYLAYVSSAPLVKTSPKSNRLHDDKLAAQTKDSLGLSTDENISLQSGSLSLDVEETTDLKVSTLDNVRDDRKKEIMGKLKPKQLVKNKIKDEKLGNTIGDNQNVDGKKALGKNKENDEESINLKNLSNSKFNEDNYITMSDESMKENINYDSVENDLIEDPSDSPELDSKQTSKKTDKQIQEKKISRPPEKSTEPMKKDAKSITGIPNNSMILSDIKQTQDVLSILNPKRKIKPYQSSWDPTMPEFNDDFLNNNGMSLQSSFKPSQSSKAPNPTALLNKTPKLKKNNINHGKESNFSNPSDSEIDNQIKTPGVEKNVQVDGQTSTQIPFPSSTMTNFLKNNPDDPLILMKTETKNENQLDNESAPIKSKMTSEYKPETLNNNDILKSEVKKIPNNNVLRKNFPKIPSNFKTQGNTKIDGPISTDHQIESPKTEFDDLSNGDEIPLQMAKSIDDDWSYSIPSSNTEKSYYDDKPREKEKKNSEPNDKSNDILLGNETEPSTSNINVRPQSKSGNIPKKGIFQKPILKRPDNIYRQSDNKVLNNPNINEMVGLINDNDSLEVIVIEESPDDIWNTEMSNPTKNINNHGEKLREHASKNLQPEDEDIDSLWNDGNKKKSDAPDINNIPQPKFNKIPSNKYQKPVSKRPVNFKPLVGNKEVGPVSSDNNNDSPNTEYEELKMGKENSIPLNQRSDSLLGKENEPSTLDISNFNGTPQSKSGNTPKKGIFQKPIPKLPDNIYRQSDNKVLNNPNINEMVGLVNDNDSLEVIVIEESPDDIWNTGMSNPTENIDNHGEKLREHASKNLQPEDEDIDSLWNDGNKKKSDAPDINNTSQPKFNKIPSNKYQKPVSKRPVNFKPLVGNKEVGPVSSDNNNDSPNTEYEELKMGKENSIPSDQRSDSLLGKENEPSTLDVSNFNGTPQSKSGNTPKKGIFQKPILKRPDNIYRQSDNKVLNNPNINEMVGLVNDNDSLEVIVIEESPDDIWNTEMSNPTENIDNHGEKLREHTSKNLQPEDEDIDSLWNDGNKKKSDAQDINKTPQPKFNKIPLNKNQKPIPKRPVKFKPLVGNKEVGPVSSDNNNDSPNTEYEELNMGKENLMPLDQHSVSLLGKENEPSTSDVPQIKIMPVNQYNDFPLENDREPGISDLNGTPQNKYQKIPKNTKFQKPIPKSPDKSKSLRNNKKDDLVSLDHQVEFPITHFDEISNGDENLLQIARSLENNWDNSVPSQIIQKSDYDIKLREKYGKNSEPKDQYNDSLLKNENENHLSTNDEPVITGTNGLPQHKYEKLPKKSQLQIPTSKSPGKLKSQSDNKIVESLSPDRNDEFSNVEDKELKEGKENLLPKDNYDDIVSGSKIENTPVSNDEPVTSSTNSIPHHTYEEIPKQIGFENPSSKTPEKSKSLGINIKNRPIVSNNKNNLPNSKFDESINKDKMYPPIHNPSDKQAFMPQTLNNYDAKPTYPNEKVIAKSTTSDINNPKTEKPFGSEWVPKESKTNPGDDSKNNVENIPLLISEEDINDIWDTDKPNDGTKITPVVSALDPEESNYQTIAIPSSLPESLTHSNKKPMNLEENPINEPTMTDLDKLETKKNTDSHKDFLEPKTSPGGDSESILRKIPLLNSKKNVSSEIWGTDKPVDNPEIEQTVNKHNPDKTNFPTINSPGSKPVDVTNNGKKSIKSNEGVINKPTASDINNPETKTPLNSEDKYAESKIIPGGDSKNNFGDIPILNSKEDTNEIWGTNKPNYDTNIPSKVYALKSGKSNSPIIDSSNYEPGDLLDDDEKLLNLKGNTINEPTMTDLNNPETKINTDSNKEPLESKTSSGGGSKNIYGEIPSLNSNKDISSEIWGSEKPVDDTNIPPEVSELRPNESNPQITDSPISEPEGLTGNDEELTNLEEDTMNEPNMNDLNNTESDKTPSLIKEPLESKTSLDDGDSKNNFGEIPKLISNEDISSDIWGINKSEDDTTIPPRVSGLYSDEPNSQITDSPISEPEGLTVNDKELTNLEEDTVNEPTANDSNNPESDKTTSFNGEPLESKTSPGGHSKNIYGEIPSLNSNEDVSSEIWGSEKPVDGTNIPSEVNELRLDEPNSQITDSPISEPEGLTVKDEELTNLEEDTMNEPNMNDLNNTESDKTPSLIKEPLESKTSLDDGDSKNNFGEIPKLISNEDISSDIWGINKSEDDTTIPPRVSGLYSDEPNSQITDSPISEPEGLTVNDKELTNLEEDTVNEPTANDLNNPESDKTTSFNGEPLESKTSPGGHSKNIYGEIPSLNSNEDVSSEIWGSEKPVDGTNIPSEVNELRLDEPNSQITDSPISEPEGLTVKDEELTNLEEDTVNEPTANDLNNPESDKTTSFNGEPLESKTSPGGDSKNIFGDIPSLNSNEDISSEIWGSEKPVDGTNIPLEVNELRPNEPNPQITDSPISEPEGLTVKDEELTNLEEDTVNEPTANDLNNPESDKTTSSNEEPQESKTSPGGDSKNIYGEIPSFNSNEDISSEIWGSEKPVDGTNIPSEVNELRPDEPNSQITDSPISEPESFTNNDKELTNLEEDTVNEPNMYDLNNPESDKTTSSNEEPQESKTSPGGDSKNIYGEIPSFNSNEDISSEIWGSEKPVDGTNIPSEVNELRPDEPNSQITDSPISEPESFTNNDKELTNLEEDTVNEPNMYDLNNPESDKTTSSNEEPQESKTSPGGDSKNIYGEIPSFNSNEDISSEIWGSEKPVDGTNIPSEVNELRPDEPNSQITDSPISEPESFTNNDKELTNLEEDTVNEPNMYDLNNPESDKTTSSNEEPQESKTSPGGDSKNIYGEIPSLNSNEDISSEIWGSEKPVDESNIPPERSELFPDKSNSPIVHSPSFVSDDSNGHYEKPINSKENVHEPTTSDFNHSDAENRISSEVEPDTNFGEESENIKNEYAGMNSQDLDNVPYIVTPYDESETVEVDPSCASSEKSKSNLMLFNSNVGLPNLSTPGEPILKIPEKSKTFLDSSSFNKMGDISILSSGSKNPNKVGNTGLPQPIKDKSDINYVPIEKIVNKYKAGNQINKHKENSPNGIKSAGSNIIYESSSGSNEPSKNVKLPIPFTETPKNKSKMDLDNSLSSNPNSGATKISHANSNGKSEKQIPEKNSEQNPTKSVNVPDRSIFDTNQVTPNNDMNTGTSKPMLNYGDEPSNGNQKDNLQENQGNEPVNTYQDMQLFKPNSIPSSDLSKISRLNQFGYMIPKFRNNYEGVNSDYDLWESLPPKQNMKPNRNFNKDVESKIPMNGSYHNNVVSNNVNIDKNSNPNTENFKNNDENKNSNNNNNNNNKLNDKNEKYDDFIKSMSEVLGKINDINTKISKLENSNKANNINSKDNVNIDELRNNDLSSNIKLTTKQKKKIKKEIDTLSPNLSLEESSNDSNESDESDDINDSEIAKKLKQNQKNKNSESRIKKHNDTTEEKNNKNANLKKRKKNNNDDTESVKRKNKQRKSKKAKEIISTSEISSDEVDDTNNVENIDESNEPIEELKINRKSNKTSKKKKKKKMSTKTKSKQTNRSKKKLTEDDSNDEQTTINDNDIEINHKQNIIRNKNKQTKKSKNGKNRRNNNVVKKTIENNTVKTENKTEITKNDSDNEANDGYQLVTFYPQYAYTNPFSRLFSRTRPMYRSIL